jgi:hypothetical protein
MNQQEKILNHLREYGHITALQAIGVYRIFNLKGRVYDLRAAGWNVQTDMVSDATGKRYARYHLGLPNRIETQEAA